MAKKNKDDTPLFFSAMDAVLKLCDKHNIDKLKVGPDADGVTVIRLLEFRKGTEQYKEDIANRLKY